MFSTEQLRESLAEPNLHEDLTEVRRSLATYRLDQEAILDPQRAERLEQFIEAVLASAPGWERGDGTDVVLRAAEVAELLTLGDLAESASHERLRAALLYELAEQPMMAAAVYSSAEGPELLGQFFRREGPFNSLASDIVTTNGTDPEFAALLPYAAAEDALGLARFEHSVSDDLASHEEALAEAASRLNAGMNLSEARAFSSVVGRRSELATRRHAPSAVAGPLRQIGFPPELWGAQAAAVKGGILDPANDAWGLAGRPAPARPSSHGWSSSMRSAKTLAAGSSTWFPPAPSSLRSPPTSLKPLKTWGSRSPPSPPSSPPWTQVRRKRLPAPRFLSSHQRRPTCC